MTNLPLLINLKKDNYNFIFIIVDWLIKIVHYKLIKITFNAPKLAKSIMNIIVQHYDLQNFIITNKSLLFNSKFWSILYYFFGIKCRLLSVFYS